MSSLVLIGVIWKQTHDETVGTVRRETTEEADALLAVWRDGGIAAVRSAIAHARAPGDESLLLAVLDERGRRLIGYAPALVGVRLEDTAFQIADLDASAKVREAGYTLHPLGAHWLLVGRSLDLLWAEQQAIERALGLAVLVSLALGLGAGVVVARYVARRLDAIAGVIDAAGEGDLSLRVAAQAAGDDAFDRLAARLNTMLERTERLMGELRVVTDSLAHDLRSPLARLRTKTEQAVTLGDPAAREAALSGLLVETDLVMQMLTTVIEISRSEATSRDRFTSVAPAELIGAVAELYDPVVEEAGLGFRSRHRRIAAGDAAASRTAQPGDRQPARQRAAPRRGGGRDDVAAGAREWRRRSVGRGSRPGHRRSRSSSGDQALRPPRHGALGAGRGAGHGAGRRGGAAARWPARTDRQRARTDRAHGVAGLSLSPRGVRRARRRYGLSAPAKVAVSSP